MPIVHTLGCQRLKLDVKFVPHDGEAEALVHELQIEGYAVVAIVEQEATSRLVTVRLQPPGESESGVVLDLLFASFGIEREVVDAPEVVQVLSGLEVPVAVASIS